MSTEKHPGMDEIKAAFGRQPAIGAEIRARAEAAAAAYAEQQMAHHTRIAEIRAREAAATEGPWEAKGTTSDDWYPRVIGPIFDAIADLDIESECAAADAEFIAAARADVPWLLAEIDRLEAERDAWCLACPHDCHECAGRDCECYEHQDLHPEHLKAEVDRLRTELVSTTDHLVGAMSVVRAERDRARDTAVTLEQEIAKVTAERDEATRELCTESAERLRLAEAIQRVRDIPMKGDYPASDDWEDGYLACEADVQRALDGEVPDGD